MRIDSSMRRSVGNQAIKERGVVLVIVLWVLVLLGIIVGSYLGTIRTDMAIVDNWVTTTKSRWAAHAGVELTLLKTMERGAKRWTSGDTIHTASFNGTLLKIRIHDEAGKVDINYASKELLQALFRSVGVSDNDTRYLIASIMRRRSQTRPPRGITMDNLIPGLGGSNNGSNANLYQNIEELARLPGMRPEIMRRIQPMITIYSGVNGVNPEVASKQVLQLLPGIEPEQVDQFIATRQDRNARDNNSLVGIKHGYLHKTRGLLLNIHVEAEMPDGSKAASSVIVRLDERRGRGKKPYTILEWNDLRNPVLKQKNKYADGAV